MADVSIVASDVANAPQNYKVPGAQEIILRAVAANMNGSNATGAFLPAFQLLDPAGHVMFTAVNRSSPVAAGASAVVSWFPGGGVDEAGVSTSGGISLVTSPVGTIAVSNPTGPTTSLDITSTGVSAGTYADGTHVPQITVDAYGRITAAANVGITAGGAGVVEYDYAQITADVTITGTTEGTATACIDGHAVTYDGTTKVRIEVSAPNLDHTGGGSSSGLYVVLLEDSTVVGWVGNVFNPTASGTIEVPLNAAHYRTPAAGSHTYHVKAFKTGGTAAFRAGPGGSANFKPAYLRISNT